ncbi:TPA: hypothetical protein QC443_002461 [Bacillus cereus]|uniref:hypothetical protein n=1 Tax=Bacillus paranthracis TaxID=2026186 RepID=UPI0029697E92|nr:hypothetical protein [Bacillus cereus]HDR8076390.1 hypothetical protein [Bacillus cereus]HDR8205441.1 hypothetical protein [Bacillus cereus]HDR8210828.1 hypothetical protein [Bacillus cereus]HDR8224829.1 hypothetical protein [Bacillus cereus]
MKDKIKVEVTEDFIVIDNTGKVLQEFREGEQYDVNLNNDTWEFICGETVAAEYDQFGNLTVHECFKVIQ